MNDPNGLVYYSGEYNLFYQYYPDSTIWGPMHWGHSTSDDLVHWKHLPIALYPDSLGYIFSGSAAVDVNNTSGFGSAEKPPLVAIFTYDNPVLEKKGSDMFQYQGLAYSLDKGVNWTKYSGNPVLKNPGIRDFRDPKIFWHDRTGKWITILAVKDRVQIYSSPDMKNWALESEFGTGAGAHGGVWECPDLFPLNIEGQNAVKWIMLVSINPGGPNGGSATQYFVGEFDGHKFVPDDNQIRWVDLGRDDYAGVTWSGVPDDDGRRIFIGWMSNWDYATVVPTSPWRGAFTIPRELSLKFEHGKCFISSKPVKEFWDLRSISDTCTIMKLGFTGEKELPINRITLMQSELLFGFNMSETRTDTLGIILENSLKERFVIGYSFIKKQFYIDRNKSGNIAFSDKFAGIIKAAYNAGPVMKLHILIDASSVELFVDDGRLAMTTLVFPTEKFTALKVFSNGGTTFLNKAVFNGIKRIW